MKKILLFSVVLLIMSCEDENFEPIQQEEKNSLEKKETIVNGRLVFSSKESLSETIEELKNQESKKIERKFEKLYEKGFRSHKPIINPENEQLQAKFSEEYLQKGKANKPSLNYSSKDTDTEEDEFISDPFLASVVNGNNEIIVNDTLYKFTEEKGLFFAHVKDSTYLLDYFKEENENVSKSTSAKNASIRIQPCEMRAQYGGVTKVNRRISRYLRPIKDDCERRSSSSGSNRTSVPRLSDDEKLQQIITGLPECYGSKPFFQNIFGKTFVCRNYFDKKHRIKTEFWNQDYLIYQSVGIQTKTQRRRFGVWWASKSDEIYLGINRILLKYNFPQPQINSYTHPQLFSASSYKNPIYMWDGKFKVNVSNSSFGTFVDTQLNLPDGKLPFFDFGDDQILNIYIPKLYKKGKYNLNLTTQDITSQSNIKALYKMGIDFLNSPNVANSGSKPKNFSIIYQKDYNDIEVVYFGELIKKTNTNYAKRTLYDSGANFAIGAAWGEDSGWSFSVKPVKDFFRDYTYYDLDFYAMARRGGTWKGNRMIREEKK